MFQYKLRTDLQFGGDVNSIFIEILYNSSNTKRNIICGCIYRPPQMSLHIFNELLSQMFGKIQHENTVGAKEMFTLLKQQKIFLAKQGIKFHISLSLLSVGGV